ncbi:hypothetical protein ABZ387_26270 [Streptomyces flaveolus]
MSTVSAARTPGSAPTCSVRKAYSSKDDDECNAAGPSFFSRKRLTGINTVSYNATSGAYDPVDSWALTEEYLDGGDIGDSSDQVLTLKSIKRTAKAGDTSITLAPVTFTYQMRPNRVDAARRLGRPASTVIRPRNARARDLPSTSS